MTKYIKKNLVNIIKADSKKIRKKASELKLTEIMNTLSVFFGFRNFNELKKASENDKNYTSGNFKNLEDLNNGDFNSFYTKYSLYIKDFLFFSSNETPFVILKFINSKLQNTNTTKEISNGIYSKNKKDYLKIDLTTINPVFKINDLEKKDIKYYCEKENIDLAIYSEYISFEHGVSLSNIKKSTYPIVFYYKKNNKKLEKFLKLFFLVVKNYINKNKDIDKQIVSQMQGHQIIQQCSEDRKLDIIKNIFKNDEKIKIGVFNFNNIDYDNKNIRIYEDIKSFRTCIRYCKPDVLIFNNPDIKEWGFDLYELNLMGYLVIIFTDTNYNHFNMIEDNNQSYLSEVYSLHSYNTYNALKGSSVSYN